MKHSGDGTTPILALCVLHAWTCLAVGAGAGPSPQELERLHHAGVATTARLASNTALWQVEIEFHSS
ncbi:MAG TPA: hypothetical protein PKM73_09885 [Verrucomicrobiota bacterium]|nr:hypothetical protein [Verrucomicrobiota bacterium]